MAEFDVETLYELVADAAATAFAEQGEQGDYALSGRMAGGEVVFRDDQDRIVKTIPTLTFFKKVTSVREKLRVLEQKLNNNKSLSDPDKAELQAYITRCYGSLTTFNFLFADDADRFRGSGS